MTSIEAGYASADDTSWSQRICGRLESTNTFATGRRVSSRAQTGITISLMG
jgi:hypothetical protein